jgi:hypothetical protein
MTIQTITTAPTGQPEPTDPFQAGIHDARTDATTAGFDIIWLRAQWIAQYADPSYADGYITTVAALLADETELAYIHRDLTRP